MFATLKRAFQGDRDPAQERITSRKKIVALLRQLKTERELLCVSVPGCSERANSAILGVKVEQNQLYLDELSLERTHQAFTTHRKARIDCRLQGMELRFAAHLLKTRRKDGIALYELEIPKYLVWIQRREHFRLRLNPGLMVPVTIPYFEGETVSGEAFDISLGGIGLFLKTRNLPSRGQVISKLSLTLPRCGPFKADVEIRFARLDSAHQMLRIGGRFIGMDKKQERLLSRFLAENQRKRRRRGPP